MIVYVLILSNPLGEALSKDGSDKRDKADPDKPVTLSEKYDVAAMGPLLRELDKALSEQTDDRAKHITRLLKTYNASLERKKLLDRKERVVPLLTPRQRHTMLQCISWIAETFEPPGLYYKRDHEIITKLQVSTVGDIVVKPLQAIRDSGIFTEEEIQRLQSLLKDRGPDLSLGMYIPYWRKGMSLEEKGAFEDGDLYGRSTNTAGPDPKLPG